MKTRRYILTAIATCVLTWLLALAGCSSQNTLQSNVSPVAQPSPSSSSQVKVINIGHQSGTPGLNLLKARGLLEKRLTPEGIQVKWISFQGGPPMMEAMAADSVDIGNVGNLPPVFAQAGGNPILYVAATGSNAGAQAIIVPKDSPIKTLADLKGKKLAIQKGTALQYFVLKALESAKLKLTDIQPVYLKIPDSTTAFEGGNVDALPIGDPYLASKELNGSVHVLVRGSDVAPQRAFYIATENFTKNHPDLVKIVLEEQTKVEDWAKANPTEVAKLLAVETKYKPEVLEYSLKNRPYFGVFEMKDEYIAEQQQVVDLFYNQKLIPKTFQVKDAIWKP
ncbi:aliphatic sulfonate ABC transporter substrate-binding protein [Tolypothrix sp. PCC 7910]|uniref:aliphatic sulfonate ABC transporter substrate-binding protein n=1 Tax=Tolypothrix sp. PCC 7910 TaxID=2099387 RepID=UPI0014278587|nr:aliphatic sulfonate ABC transporter substrate-binding protein [Tolypothrix sp. PCC 7910]QIR35998.1 aliphatic sulfonate ABC transporter substrate-binding protein [Tolypothrix sp. PCC 7910]